MAGEPRDKSLGPAPPSPSYFSKVLPNDGSPMADPAEVQKTSNLNPYRAAGAYRFCAVWLHTCALRRSNSIARAFRTSRHQRAFLSPDDVHRTIPLRQLPACRPLSRSLAEDPTEAASVFPPSSIRPGSQTPRSGISSGEGSLELPIIIRIRPLRFFCSDCLWKFPRPNVFTGGSALPRLARFDA